MEDSKRGGGPEGRIETTEMEKLSVLGTLSGVTTTHLPAVSKSGHQEW